MNEIDKSEEAASVKAAQASNETGNANINKQGSISEEKSTFQRNAYLLKPARGCSLEGVKDELKKLGAHWCDVRRGWSIPQNSKQQVEELLNKSNFKYRMDHIYDDYFDKSKEDQKIDQMWTGVGILEEKAYKDEAAIRNEETLLEREIFTRDLNATDEEIVRRKEEIQIQRQNLNKIKEEITQRRASIASREAQKECVQDDSDPDENRRRVVEEMNQTFAIIETPQFGVMEFGGEKILIHKKWDFIDRFQNTPIFVGFKTQGKVKVQVFKTKAEIWLESSDRNTFYTIDFRPDKEPGYFFENNKKIYNSWRGLFIKPKQGICVLFKEHMFKVVCASDKETYEYLWKLIANWVQKPWERTCAVVLRSGQGAGKGTFTETIGKIFGLAYFITTKHEQVFGRFNAAIADKVLIHLDEALFGGDRAIIGSVKGLITSPTYAIEMKNRDPISMNNPRKVMISSNESFAIPVDADDRRFLFLDVSDSCIGDSEYFRELFKELENGGVEALLDELFKEDLSGFNPIQLPKGAQKFGFDNKIASSNSFVQYLYTALQEGTFNLEEALGKWVFVVRMDILMDRYLEFCTQRKQRPIPDESVGRELQKYLGLAGYAKKKKRYEGVLKPICKFPDLDKCRKAFAERFRTTVEIIFASNLLEEED